MNPFLTTIFLFGLGFGTMITFASSHWFLAWMGLEINTLAILPLMVKHHPRTIEASTKYFLTQAAGAAVLLFATTSNAWLTGQWEINQACTPLTAAIILLALGLKLGLAPMHAWMPEVLQGLNLPTGLILATWQKMAPLVLLLQIDLPSQSELLIALGLASTAIGGLGGLNQTQLRKLLAYSSIAHLGWAILILQYSPTLSLLAFITYTIMTMSTFLMFKMMGATSINSLSISWTKAPFTMFFAPLALLSLGGLPPLTGFMSKWLILEELTKQNLAVVATLAALTALLSLFFYMRLAFVMGLTIYPNNPNGMSLWRLTSPQFTTPLAISSSLTIALLPLTPTVMTLITL